ncbi:MAG: hypothetical protein JWN50_32 [Parcubacteria group bacterium]|nr:hypothetical protein [Parcubacteria group bacterium]
MPRQAGSKIDRVVTKAVEERIRVWEKMVRELQQSLRELRRHKNGTLVTYKVTLRSLWADHGEKSVSVQGAKPLKQLFEEANRKFLRVNHRSDVQADYSVEVIFNKSRIDLPREAWLEYK